MDLKERPELYITQNPFFNAGAVGMDHPFVTLNSSLVGSLDDEELMGVIGHELSHIISGHVLYKSLLLIMINLSTFAMNIPLGMLAIQSIIAALREWDRKSELSADRAGLLVTQDPEKSIHLLMKMAGGPYIKEMDLGEFIKQAEEYEKHNSLMDTAHKFMNTVWLSHPFPVIRAVELMNWVKSGEYDTIMRGFYNKEKSDFKTDLKSAGESYTKDMKETFGPVIDNVKDSANQMGKKAKDLFGEFFDGDREK